MYNAKLYNIAYIFSGVNVEHRDSRREFYGSNLESKLLYCYLITILEITFLYPSIYRLFLNLYFIDQFLPFEKV